MEYSRKHRIIPIFIPEMACPHRCVYCNQFLISGREKMPTDDEIKSVVGRYLETVPEGACVELAFFGGTFTGLAMEEQERLLKLVNPYIIEGRIEGVRLSTRPDYVDEENVELLKSWGVKVVELGVQTTDADVLKASGRGYGVEVVENAARLVKDGGMELGMQMMIGLPKDTKEKSVATAKSIVELGAKNTRIYPTLVMRNTVLARMYERGLYRPLSLEMAVDWTKELLWIFDRGGVLVQRVGLHPTEGLMRGEDYLDGPFHVSFKEMVMTEMWRDVLMEKLVETGGLKKCVVRVANNMLGVAAGYGGKNRKWLKECGLEVGFRGDEGLNNFDLRIEN